MNAVVLDASAAVRLVLGHGGVPTSAHEILSTAARVLVPHLFFAEVANALWKYVRAGGLKERDALDRLNEATALATHPTSDGALAEEALATAVRFSHPVYDALYAVLARRNSCPVLTVDDRLASLLESLRIDVVR